MMRSLWTAASGMKSQQTSLDTISNNLANINTAGYKKETTEFQTLLYQTIQDTTTYSNGVQKPIGAQVGLGVKVSAISMNMEQGELEPTEGAFDFGIQGKGFFMVEQPDGTVSYTRRGNFVMAVNNQGGLTLTTADGYAVLDSTGKPVSFDGNIDTTKLSFDEYGNILYKGEDGNAYPMGIAIGLAQFNNPSGLYKMGGSYYRESVASGAPRVEGEDENINRSIIRNKYLENSSVHAVDEMVDMIVTQRAYEMNSKAITASDEMLQQANNLRG